MSLELYRKDQEALTRVFDAWKANSDLELEATFPKLDYTRFSNAIQHLRSLGLTEEPQEVKLNILLPNSLRFTLVGEAVIQAFCKDNSIQGKPFHVVLKDKNVATIAAAAATAATAAAPSQGRSDGKTEVDLFEYGTRIKIRREIAIPLDDPRVTHALQKWASIPKTFRYMTRFRFVSPTGVVFDASFVKSNAVDRRGAYVPSTTFLGAGVLKQPTQYELEVEALREADQAALLSGIVAVLRGIQQSHVLVRSTVRDEVLALLYAQTRTPKGKFPGPKSVTLGREHIALEGEPGVPNLRTGDYNVTDKADGSRAFLVVTKDGRLYLADKNETVYGTDRRLAAGDATEWAGAVIDGEWVRHDKQGKPMNRFYAFDIFNGAKGADVSDRPFLTRSSSAAATRLAALTEAIGVLSKAGYSVGHIPPAHSFHIEMKTFQVPGDVTDPVGIFHVAAAMLDRAADSPYHTDGLIFTPNEAPMQKFGTWYAQLKWKPADQNSVDFLVLTERQRDAKGLATQTDLIEPKDHDGSLVHTKTLKLLVATNDDEALEDPRDTVLYKKPYMAGLRTGYRPTVFSPSPPDPMAAVCYVAINPGASDAAAATAAVAPLRLGNKDETIRCKNGDPIRSHTIVEMAYYPERAAGWRWEPMRVRWDKTEQFASGDVGAMNNDGVANGIWTSIHEPVTELMIRTGAVTEADPSAAASASAVAIAASTKTTYYQKKPSQRDQHKARGLADFHNKYIKNLVLLSKAMTPGCALLDLSVGQGGDLHKWLQGRVGFVLGCDVAVSGLTDRANGAYRRYLDQLGKQASTSSAPLVRGVPAKPAYMTKVPPMLFVQADSTKSLKDGAAGITPLDRSILRCLWGENEEKAPPAAQEMRGVANRGGFDVASLMFTLHYFFKDVGTLNGFLRNLGDSVKVGGLFVGCCFDGEAVSTLLKDAAKGEVRRGVEAEADVWTIRKQYEEPEGESGVLPPTELGLGRAIDVNFISIGATHTEYLVSFPYFQRRMEGLGFTPLNAEELAAMGLHDSTNMFEESYDMAAAAGYTYPMTPALKTFSFLNRWFIFKRRSTGRNRDRALNAAADAVAENALSAATANVEEERRAVAAETRVTENAVAAAEGTEGPTLDLLEPEGVALPLVDEEEGEAAVARGGAGGPPPAAEETAEATGAEAKAATGATGTTEPSTLYAFYHKSAAKDDFKRKDKHWRRILSTYAPFEFRDKDKADVVYPTLEAVLGAEKYKVATNRKELGPQLFGTLGTIHQNVAARLAAFSAGGKKPTMDDLSPLLEEQGDAQRDAQKPGSIKESGAKWTPKLWTSAVVKDLLATYLRQRLERDEHFRRILGDVKKAGGSLVYVGGGGELGGKVVGNEVKGENLYGEALNALLPK